MKLDVTALRYLSKDHFSILSAIEQGMKNHEVVPVTIITRIAKLRHGGVHKILSHLIRNKLIAHDVNTPYDHYRLTYSGFDFLALQNLMSRKILTAFGRQIGVGKESDIYLAITPEGTEVAVKFHRLGRTSFKAVKTKRDYISASNNSQKQALNWFYMSQLSAMKEYSFMKALHAQEFPTPTPIGWNRHAIVMSLVDGSCLFQVRRILNSQEAYNTSMDLIVRLAHCGLIHCDFNEFNLMIGDDGEITMIDFPQMISTSHPNAHEMFDRDVNGVVKYFSRLQGGGYTPDCVPSLTEVLAEVSSETRLDIEMRASGYAANEKKNKFDIHSLHESNKSVETAQQHMVHSDDDEEEDNQDEEEYEEEEEEEEEEDEVMTDEEDNQDEEEYEEEEEEYEEEDEVMTDEETTEVPELLVSDTLKEEPMMEQEMMEQEDKPLLETETAEALTTAVSEIEVDREYLRRQVKKTLERRMAAGTGKKSRNATKISIKGKIYHERDL